MTRKHTSMKRAFLLDALFYKRQRLKRFNKRYSVLHLIHDLKKYRRANLEDPQVEQIARKMKRTIVTLDTGFTKKISFTRQTSVIILVGSEIEKSRAGELDERLIKVTSLFVSPTEYEGKIIYATKTFARIKILGEKKEIIRYYKN